MSTKVIKVPSSKLLELSIEIENNIETDHFGKFYLYFALLNSITDTVKIPPNFGVCRGIDYHLPKPLMIFFTNKTVSLEIGPISPKLKADSLYYAMEFSEGSRSSGWFNYLFNGFGLWRRNSKIADLMFIFDKMYTHLSALQENNNLNQEMMDAMLFNRQDMMLLLQKALQFNQLLLSATDDLFAEIFKAITLTLAFSGAVCGANPALLLTLLPGLFFNLNSLGGLSGAAEKIKKCAGIYQQFVEEYGELGNDININQLKITISKACFTGLRQISPELTLSVEREVNSIN